jgi:hypothetical protein
MHWFALLTNTFPFTPVKRGGIADMDATLNTRDVRTCWVLTLGCNLFDCLTILETVACALYMTHLPSLCMLLLPMETLVRLCRY